MNASIDHTQVIPPRPLTLPPVDRTTLALFAGASGDHNPVHIDLDFARLAGQPDVLAHGMLVMAWLGRVLTHWVPQQRLRALNARFVRITELQDVVTCSARVTGVTELDGEPVLRVELVAADQRGKDKVLGDALVAL
jgi:acyl dehydratase